MGILEVMYQMAFRFKIVSAQSNRPVVGIIQDSIIAMYLLTYFNTMVTYAIFMLCITEIELENKIASLLQRAYKYYPDYIKYDKSTDVYYIEKDAEIPGKILASIVFPEDLFYTRSSKINENLPFVKIENGIVLPDSAPLTSESLGPKNNSIIHVLWIDYSPSICEQFLTNVEQLSYRFLPIHGFSCGISDYINTSKTSIKVAYEKTLARCREISLLNKDPISKEKMINTELNNMIMTTDAHKHMNKGEYNALTIMREAGAKGSTINSIQISSFVGQQNIEGKRLPMMLTNNTRYLPCFKPGDTNPKARGFIINSYLHGLDPVEQFADADGGRRGIMDTAIKSADIGYLSKKIGKKLEDHVYQLDGTVRSADGNIVQFLYGGDGMNGKNVFDVPLLQKNLTFVNLMRLAQKYSCNSDKKTLRKLTDQEIEMFLSFIIVGDVNIQTDVTAVAADNIKNNLRKMFEITKIDPKKIPIFCKDVHEIFQRAKNEYGEAVGSIAEDSIGESTAQLTMNTFHSSGMSAKDVTMGIPRMNEILNVTKNPINPSCTIYMNDKYIQKRLVKIKEISSIENDKQKDQTLLLKKECLERMRLKSGQFEIVYIGDVLKKANLYYCKKDNVEQTPITFIKYKEYKSSWWYRLYRDFFITDIQDDFIQPEQWVVQLEFNVELLYQKNIDLKTICSVISELYNNKFSCVPSPLNLGIIQINTKFSEMGEYVQNNLTTDLKSSKYSLYTPKNMTFFIARDVIIPMFKKIIIKGISKISKVNIREIDTTGEWVFDTKGTNLQDILCVKGVDTTKTISNDLWENLETLGIEASSAWCKDEMKSVLSFDGTYVDKRHYHLLIDDMSSSGTFTGVNEHGISRDIGPFGKGMFEKSTDNFTKAAIFTEADFLKGLSGCITMGFPPNLGTGCVTVKPRVFN